jgi:hypothetical protein|tara:strand:- start:108 stop:377 length:270 start_codon:yes stop_codon:yes gene_type:complete
LAVQVLLLGLRKPEVLPKIWLRNWAVLSAGLIARINPAVAATKGAANEVPVLLTKLAEAGVVVPELPKPTKPLLKPPGAIRLTAVPIAL